MLSGICLNHCFAAKRYNATVKLGELPESSGEIVNVLAVAAALDEDVDVRSAAMQSQQSPVHQTFLKDRPDFIRDMTRLAVENKKRERWDEEVKIREEILSRCSWQRL